MSVPRFWREFPQRYRLVGSKCGVCGRVYFPQRTVCPYCHRESIGNIVDYHLSGKGRVYTFSVVYTGPDHMKQQSPYVISIVELEEGPKITAQIVDTEPDKVEIGMPVHVVFRKIKEDGADGLIYYGFKFAPD